jgi:glycine/D-amino acid oxidase-like deaminating enzyme
MGPGIAYLATQLLRGDDPCVDPAPFRLSRLVDGSPLQIAAI